MINAVKRTVQWMIAVVVTTVLIGCAQDAADKPRATIVADTIYQNGRIYTVGDQRSWAEAMAIKDGEFIAVGSDQEVMDFVGQNTEQVDLQGAMVMPGIHDAHTHLLHAALKYGDYYCDLPYPDVTDAQVIDALKACEKSGKLRRGDWLIAGIVDEARMTSEEFIGLLNQHLPDTPVLIKDFTNHNALVNQHAMQLSGIDKNTVDPHGGKIVRRESSGEATGMLFETAVRLAYRVIPPFDDSINQAAIRWAIAQNHRYGITSVQEASAIPANLQAFKALDQQNQLALHIAAHFIVDNEKFASNSAMEAVTSKRESYASKHMGVAFSKLWLDGAPSEVHSTLAGLDHETGMIDEAFMLFSLEKLPAMIAELDRQGFSVKMHAGGFGSARAALDAISYAREQNSSDHYHEVGHAPSIHPDDLPRLASLNVVAEMSPAIWHQFPYDGSWQFNTLHKSGVLVTVGSDWLVVREPNLFPALQGMLQHGDEAVSLETALAMLTINGARAVGKEQQFGSISAGKSADFIVLNQNLFEVPVRDIGNTQVLTTVFEGRPVYQAKSRGN